MESNYIKVPAEMALFALREGKVNQVAVYLVAQFLYSGNALSSEKPIHRLADKTGYPLSSVYRYCDWLLDRNWFGKNPHGRYYFRGIDQVHKMEGWTFARAGIMKFNDFKNPKAFMAGVALGSLVETREERQREHSTSKSNTRSKHTGVPISLSVIADILRVSNSTAYRLRNLAHKCGYIENKQNLIPIVNWTPNELIELKKQDYQKITVELLDTLDKKPVNIDRIRYDHGILYLQEPNLVNPLLLFKSRRGLSKYTPSSRC